MTTPTTPTNVNNTQTSAVSLPNWYDQLGQQMGSMVSGGLGQVQNLTSNWYDKPLVQGLNQNQQQLISSGMGTVGQWQPQYDQGWGTMQQAPGAWQAAGDATGQMASGLPQGQQAWNTAAGMVGTAGQQLGAASTYDPNQMQQHLNPYTSGVLDEISRRGNEHLMEDVLPGINQSFTGAGMFGGSRHGDFTQRALRNSQREIAGAQAQAGNQAYQQAAQDYSNWGQLGTQAAGKYGDMANTLAGVGQMQATTPANIYGQQAGQFGNQAGGLGTLGNQMGQYGSMGQSARWGDLQNAYGLQEKEQANQQSGLDAMYKDWMSQVSTPHNLMGALSQMFGQIGTPYKGAATQVITPNQGGSSGLGDLLTLLGLSQKTGA